jgi:hypothetical protein
MTPASYALKDRTILNAGDNICTLPSLLPINKLSDPVHIQAISSYNVSRGSACAWKLLRAGGGSHVNDGGAIFRNQNLRNLKEIERFLLQHSLVSIQDTENVRHTEVRAISLEPTPSGDDECTRMSRAEASGRSALALEALTLGNIGPSAPPSL